MNNRSIVCVHLFHIYILLESGEGKEMIERRWWTGENWGNGERKRERERTTERRREWDREGIYSREDYREI